MIRLTKLSGGELYLNPDIIETVEETPDTHIVLTNGDRLLVLEKATVIVEKMIAYKARIMHRAGVIHKKKYLQRRQIEGFRPVCPLPRTEWE